MINDWLNQNYSIFQVAQILGWAANHPIISFIILLFVLAILGNIIQAIARLIEVTSRSILQVPLKLIFGIIKISFLSLVQVGNLAANKLSIYPKNDQELPVIPIDDSPGLQKDKQERLAEISQRLAEIQKEQYELLKEVREILSRSV